MNFSIWAALGFMVMGGVIDRVFASREWKKYYEGKDESRIYTADAKTKPAATLHVIQGRRPA